MLFYHCWSSLLFWNFYINAVIFQKAFIHLFYIPVFYVSCSYFENLLRFKSLFKHYCIYTLSCNSKSWCSCLFKSTLHYLLDHITKYLNVIIETHLNIYKTSKNKSRIWILILSLHKRPIPHRINLVDPASYQRDWIT